MKTKEEFEKNLNTKAETYTKLPDEEKPLYRRRLVDDIYFYYLTYFSKYYKDNEENFNISMSETAKDCFRGYNPETGPFMNLFNYSLSRNLKKKKQEEIESRKYVGRIPDKTLKLVRDFNKFAQIRGFDRNNLEAQQKYAEATGYSLKELQEAIYYERINTRQDHIVQDSESGDEVNIIDELIPNNVDVEKDINEESAERFIDCINDEYLVMQNRDEAKKIIKIMMTRWVLEKGPSIELIKYLMTKPVCSKIVVELYCKNKYLVKARDVAEQFHKEESSISRTFNNFQKKVRERWKKLDN